MPTDLVATCAPADYDAGTNTCAQIVWVSQPVGFLPELTINDGESLAQAIGLLFIVAWCFKEIRRSTSQYTSSTTSE